MSVYVSVGVWVAAVHMPATWWSFIVYFIEQEYTQ